MADDFIEVTTREGTSMDFCNLHIFYGGCFSSCEIVRQKFVGQIFKSYRLSRLCGAYAENVGMCVLMFTCGNLNLKIFKYIVQ